MHQEPNRIRHSRPRLSGRWIITLIVLGMGVGSCGSSGVTGAESFVAYERALSESDPSRVELVAEGSDVEVEAIARIVHMYADFSPDRVKETLRDTYADDIFFRDPFKEVRGIDAAEEYFVESAAACAECRFDIQHVISSEGNVYLRWVATMRLERWKDEPANRVVGMSHLRLDPDGKVVFHQDYFDTTRLLWEKIPVVGWVVRKVRAQL